MVLLALVSSSHLGSHNEGRCYHLFLSWKTTRAKSRRYHLTLPPRLQYSSPDYLFERGRCCWKQQREGHLEGGEAAGERRME